MTEFLAKIAASFVFAFLLALLTGFVAMWIINGIFSPQLLLFVFGVAKIEFWRAYCIALLAGLLKGGS